MAPETLAGKSATPVSDLYSLGALMYELFTLNRAHPGKTTAAVLHHTTAGNVIPPFTIGQRIQGRVAKDHSDIIMKLLAKSPANRYQSAQAVREAVRACLDGEAPVVCLCTGAKRVTFSFIHSIDQMGALAVVLGTLWLLFPVVVIGLMASGFLVFHP
jgi:serine/threonine protein kinase